MNRRVWAVVLAGGDGQRVRGLLRDRSGKIAPKQYCTLDGGQTLLRRTIERAQQIASHQQLVTVVAEKHRDWWVSELCDLPPRNILVQPENRGTAVGILFSALHVFERYPDATLVYLPSDHWIEKQTLLGKVLQNAIRMVQSDPVRLVLLGISPESADDQYGWIEPGANIVAGGAAVSRFLEKPGRLETQRLMRHGGLWNSFLFVATARTILDLYLDLRPDLLRSFRLRMQSDGISKIVLTELYKQIPTSDFSRDILERATGLLSVVRVPACGWADLGTPGRIAKWLEQRSSKSGTAIAAGKKSISLRNPTKVQSSQFVKRGA